MEQWINLKKFNLSKYEGRKAESVVGMKFTLTLDERRRKYNVSI